jgi:hypothetical protein
LAAIAVGVAATFSYWIAAFVSNPFGSPSTVEFWLPNPRVLIQALFCFCFIGLLAFFLAATIYIFWRTTVVSMRTTAAVWMRLTGERNRQSD